VIDQTLPGLPGYIYFIRAGSTPFVKIGWTRNLRMRLSVLQTGNQDTLKVLRVLSGGREREGSLHALFHRLRRRGEWFEMDGGLEQFIASAARDCVMKQAMAAPRLEPLTEDECAAIIARVEGATPTRLNAEGADRG